MIDAPTEVYLWIKALHIISAIAWMAGLLYLPRLFVYHCEADEGSEFSEKLKIMERRLMKLIMRPARLTTLFFGLIMLLNFEREDWFEIWVSLKLVFVALLFILHDMLEKWRKCFEFDLNKKTQKFFRIVNEAPTLLLILIIIAVVIKPF